MPKFVAHYPDGLAGLALLLLRISCAAVALYIVPALAILHDNLAVFVGAFIALSLLAGLFTRWGALLLAAAIVLDVTSSSALPAVPDLGLLGASTALALLGPGAYSIDARRFGRRVIQLQSQPPHRGDET